LRKFYSQISFIIRILMKIIWNYEVVNQDVLQNSQACILASNHLSWFDPPFIGAITPYEIAYLAKSDLFKYKFSDKFLRLANCIPVNRNQTDMKAISAVLNVLDSGKTLLLFPQGGTKRRAIKPGVGLFAMKMQKDIIPIFIENADRPFSCMFRIKKTKIIIGNPIRYETYADWEQTKDNYQKLANLVFEKIVELRKTPPSLTKEMIKEQK